MSESTPPQTPAPLPSRRARRAAQEREQEQAAQGSAGQEMADGSATVALDAVPGLTRRELREQRRALEESRSTAAFHEVEDEDESGGESGGGAGAAGRAASAGGAAAAGGAASDVAGAAGRAAAAATPADVAPAGPPTRRSMRERMPPASPSAGRGERVGPGVIVPPPAAAQSVRGVDASGALTQARPRRTATDSPIEVTGTLDWASSVTMTPVPEPATAAEPTAPERTSVLGKKPTTEPAEAGAVTHAAASSSTPAAEVEEEDGLAPAWVPVSGGAATLPASFEPAPAERADPAPAAPPRRGSPWRTVLGFVVLVLLGIGIGAAIFFIIFA